MTDPNRRGPVPGWKDPALFWKLAAIAQERRSYWRARILGCRELQGPCSPSRRTEVYWHPLSAEGERTKPDAEFVSLLAFYLFVFELMTNKLAQSSPPESAPQASQSPSPSQMEDALNLQGDEAVRVRGWWRNDEQLRMPVSFFKVSKATNGRSQVVSERSEVALGRLGLEFAGAAFLNAVNETYTYHGVPRHQLREAERRVEKIVRQVLRPLSEAEQKWSADRLLRLLDQTFRDKRPWLKQEDRHAVVGHLLVLAGAWKKLKDDPENRVKGRLSELKRRGRY